MAADNGERVGEARSPSFGSSANTKDRRTRNSPLAAGVAARLALSRERPLPCEREFATNRRVASFE